MKEILILSCLSKISFLYFDHNVKRPRFAEKFYYSTVHKAGPVSQTSAAFIM